MASVDTYWNCHFNWNDNFEPQWQTPVTYNNDNNKNVIKLALNRFKEKKTRIATFENKDNILHQVISHKSLREILLPHQIVY